MCTELTTGKRKKLYASKSERRRASAKQTTGGQKSCTVKTVATVSTRVWDVRNVLGMRIVEIPLVGGKTRSEVQYLCTWDKYPDSDATWDPEKNVNEQSTLHRPNDTQFFLVEVIMTAYSSDEPPARTCRDYFSPILHDELTTYPLLSSSQTGGTRLSGHPNKRGTDW